MSSRIVSRISLSVALSALACSAIVACTDSTVPAPAGEAFSAVVDASGRSVEQAMHWSERDRPDLFGKDLVAKAKDLPLSGEAARIPWAGSYWPTYQDSINYKWDGATSDAPSTKYAKAMGLQGIEDRVSALHGVDSARNAKVCKSQADCATAGDACAIRDGKTEGRCIPSWFGICHAWAPAAIDVPEPQHSVTKNGVTFEVADLKALATMVFNNVETRFVSGRCNSNDDAGRISCDEFGRPLSPECTDTNPGTFHLLMTNYLGLKHQAFVYDRTYDDQVWNQPLRGYRITKQEDVPFEKANELVGGKGTTYAFNPAAVAFQSVHMSVDYISESDQGANDPLASTIDRYTQHDEYDYVLELDADGLIIGGEWVGASKRVHPDFLWLPVRGTGGQYAGIDQQTVLDLVDASVVPLTPLLTAESDVAEKVIAIHTLDVVAGQSVRVETKSDKDIDLYVRMGADPTLEVYDAVSGNATGDEVISFTAKESGVLHIGVNGFVAAHYTLSVLPR